MHWHTLITKVQLKQCSLNTQDSYKYRVGYIWVGSNSSLKINYSHGDVSKQN